MLNLLTAALVVSVSLEAGPQSLADVAKKTQEERSKTSTPPAKVIKNEDLKPGRVPSDAPHEDANTSAEILKKQDAAKPGDANAKPGEANTKPAATPATPPSGEKGEAYWRGRWTPLHDKLTTDEAKRAEINGRLAPMTAQMRTVPLQSAEGAALVEERNKVLVEARAIEQEIAADIAALTALEAEGKKAGALEAWFR